MSKKVSNLENLLQEIKITGSGESLDFIKQYNIKDRSKIGDEFEGIAKKVFDKSLPEDLECFRGSQVMYLSNQELSYKVDLVVAQEGSSIQLPNSTNSIIPSEKLLAAFEVKKTYTKKFLAEDIKKIVKLKEKIIDDIVGSKMNIDPTSIDYANKLFEDSVIKSFKNQDIDYNSDKVTKLQCELYEQFKLQGRLPFTSCFGFGGSLSKEKFIQAFIEGTDGHRVSAWPDIVTCGKMNIVKLDERPYNLSYHYLDDEKVKDICVVYMFFESDSLAPYVEHIWEKLNTNISFGKTSHIRSDTVETFSPLLALVTLKKEEGDKVVYIRMEGDVKLDYSDRRSIKEIFLEIINDDDPV